MVRHEVATGTFRVLLKLPTGAGKTRTAAEIIKGARAKGRRVVFTVPAISLIDQTLEAFEAEGIYEIGVMQASHPRTDWRQPVQIVSVQTLARRERPLADVVIVDECHQQYQSVIDWMVDSPQTVFIGLSATPWAKGLGDQWQKLVIPVRMQELIDEGYLSPFRVYAPSHPDLSGVKVLAGDYHEGQLADVMGSATLVADVVQTWLQRGKGLPTLVFAVNKAHAAQLVDEFAEAGVRMGYCDDSIDLIERRTLFDRMGRGELAGIVNIATLTTGVDADIRCVVLARPTKSEMLFVQMIGRGLRAAPGKTECIILDHADNHDRLGFVTDIHHETLLTGRDKKHETRKDKGDALPKECPSCGVLKPPRLRQCDRCGFEPKRSPEVETADGELVEFKPKSGEKFTKDTKQRFWSMALHIDRHRNKGGRLAKALYRSKFGVWPQGLAYHAIEPDSAFLGYERSRRIAYAKRKGARS